MTVGAILIRANLASILCRNCQVSRHGGRDCRHPEHMDVLVSLAIHGIWIPAIPAGMTLLSLSWRVWGQSLVVALKIESQLWIA